MPTEAKARIISQTKEIADSSTGLIFTEYRGLTVKALSQLRRQLKGAGAEYHVVKNTLFRLAAPEHTKDLPEACLSGPTAICFIRKDESVCAKILADYMKDHHQLTFKGAYLSGRVLSDTDVVRLSKLPSRDELLAQVIGLVQAPVREVVSVINETVAQVVRVIGAIEEQKSGAAAA
jgi:large subunit ribosomal protein L10